MEVESQWGEHISSFAARLVRAADEHGTAKGIFNEVEVVADRGASAEELCAQWDKKCEARHVAYINSPEGKAAAAKREADIAAAQEKHDGLVHDLTSLNFKDDVAVLDWLCAVQDCTDHVSVVTDKARILSAFRAAGFEANANCGSAYRGDRDNEFRYLVGQAMDGLETVAIHGIIHKFVDDWKAKFIRTQ